MPTVERRRTIAAKPADVWRVASDPHHLPRWWPGVERVEDVAPETWTKVLRSPGGKVVKADFTMVEADEPRRLAWRQEVEASAFERILRSSLTELTIDPGGGGGSDVTLRAAERLRGLSRLGGFMLRRAARRRLDEALANLDRVVGAR